MSVHEQRSLKLAFFFLNMRCSAAVSTSVWKDKMGVSASRTPNTMAHHDWKLAIHGYQLIRRYIGDDSGVEENVALLFSDV